MSKELVISTGRHETRVAILEDEQLVEIYFERANEYSLAGSIHKGRVTRVLPGMQSAFVDLGLERDTFLYVSDFLDEHKDDIDHAEDRGSSHSSSRGASGESNNNRRERGGRGRRDRGRFRREAGAGAAPQDHSDALTPLANYPPESAPLESSEAEEVSAEASAAPAAGARSSEEDDRNGRRRGRRRGRRGRSGAGIPESKYARGPVGEEGDDAPVEREEELESGASAVEEEAASDRIVLPGESLSKYRRSGGAMPPPLPPEAFAAEAAAEEEEEEDEVVAEVLHEEPAHRHSVFEASMEPEARVDMEVEADAAQERAEAALKSAELSGIDPAEALDLQATIEDVAAPAADDEAEGEEGEEDAPGTLPDIGSAHLNVDNKERLQRRDGGRRRRRRRRPGERRDVPGATPAEGEAADAAPADDEDENLSVAADPAEAVDAEAPQEQEESEERAAAPSSHRRERRERAPLPSISELLKVGQEILVQIAKEPLGQKGARITSHIALPGRYCVYMPTVEHTGVSRRISSDEERQRLKKILLRHREGLPGGFILRTAGEGHTEEEIAQDMRFLAQLWQDIRKKAESRRAPALIYHDLEVVERILRDQLGPEFKTIWADNEEVYENILRFLHRFMPNMVSRVRMYTRDTPIFDAFGITQELDKALHSKVWLKSGGYIVINQTEALVAIDINTGKFIGRSNKLEDTIARTNLDAVKEIVRQIRLRDLGGIIVIDFIDMDERKNRQKVMQALEEAMRVDRAPYKILQFNDFGLVAITRKRVKQSLERTLCSGCPYCEGTGYVKSVSTVIGDILSEARRIASAVEGKECVLRVNPEVAKLLKQTSNEYHQELEEALRRPVMIVSDPLLHQEKFDLT
jgi:ribonuclease G